MKVTGYQLREALKTQELRRDTAARAFNGSLFVFPGETKETPHAVVDAYLAAETAIARLQVAQKRYNLAVMVTVQGETMTLEEAIKRVGGPARAEKLWRQAAGEKKDRYSGYDDPTVRDPGKIVATPTVSVKDAMRLSTVQAKSAGAFRAAIAQGNAREMYIEDLNPALFE